MLFHTNEGKAEEEKGLKISISPGNTTYYIPFCDDKLRPQVGMVFQTWQQGANFYKDYARACGFQPRSGTTTRSRDGSIIWKFMLCNKEGFRKESTTKIAQSTTTKQIVAKTEKKKGS